MDLESSILFAQLSIEELEDRNAYTTDESERLAIREQETYLRELIEELELQRAQAAVLGAGSRQQSTSAAQRRDTPPVPDSPIFYGASFSRSTLSPPPFTDSHLSSSNQINPQQLTAHLEPEGSDDEGGLVDTRHTPPNPFEPFGYVFQGLNSPSPSPPPSPSSPSSSSLGPLGYLIQGLNSSSSSRPPLPPRPSTSSWAISPSPYPPPRPVSPPIRSIPSQASVLPPPPPPPAIQILTNPFLRRTSNQSIFSFLSPLAQPPSVPASMPATISLLRPSPSALSSPSASSLGSSVASTSSQLPPPPTAAVLPGVSPANTRHSSLFGDVGLFGGLFNAPITPTRTSSTPRPSVRRSRNNPFESSDEEDADGIPALSPAASSNSSLSLSEALVVSRPLVPSQTCIACTEKKTPALEAPCHHYFCASCLEDQIRNIVYKDQFSYPFRCCKNWPMTSDMIAPHLSPNLRGAFEVKSKELSVPLLERVYCENPRCATFLGRLVPGIRYMFCSKCLNLNFIASKSDNLSKTSSPELAQLAWLNDWRACYQCHTTIEQKPGCDHIQCICGAEFCYACGAKWKTCTCPIWTEGRLIEGVDLEL